MPLAELEMPTGDKEYNGQKEERKRISSVLQVLAQDIESGQENRAQAFYHPPVTE